MSDEELMKGMKVKWEEASPTTWQEWRQSDIERLDKHVELLKADRDIWIDRYADSQNTMAIWRFAAVTAFIGIGVAFVRHIWR